MDLRYRRIPLTLLSLFVVLVNFAFYQTAFANDSPAARPNILLIMADDLGYECLGVNGGASYDTPHLDALAAGGMRFTACHSQPLCTPSRVKIMTGKSNARNYVEFQMLPPGERTFGHLLKAAGYDTAVAGKWQLYGLDGERTGRGTLPQDAGFDEYCLWQVHNKESRYPDPSIEYTGEPAEKLAGRYGPDVFLDYMKDFIAREREAPFLLYYPMCLPHSPFSPSPVHPDWDEDRWKNDPKYFKSMVEYMDKIVGELVAQLEKTGQRENTLVIFVGDNGTHQRIRSVMADGTEVQGAKGETIDTGTHVPMIASWPTVVPAGAVNNHLVGFADFLPTLAAAAGIELPAETVLDGESFLPQLRGGVGVPHKALFTHYEPRWNTWGRSRYARTHQYKLYDDGRFYDVQADPLEQTPIPAHTEPDIHATLQITLATMAGIEQPARIVSE